MADQARQTGRGGVGMSSDSGSGGEPTVGEMGIPLPTGAKPDPRGDFELHYRVNRRDLFRAAEQLMKDGRRDVIGQIPVHAKCSARQLGKIELENVAGHDLNARPLVRLGADGFFEASSQPRVGLNRDQAAASGGEHAGHLAVTRTDLDPHIVQAPGQSIKNPFLPTGSVQEMLT